METADQCHKAMLTYNGTNVQYKYIFKIFQKHLTFRKSSTKRNIYHLLVYQLLSRVIVIRKTFLNTVKNTKAQIENINLKYKFYAENKN